MAIIHWEMRNKRVDAFGYTFKSKCEYRWACYLNLLCGRGSDDCDWSYEPKTFEFGERWRKRRIYTPDFLYIEEGQKIYHEVKTSLRQVDVTRFRCMATDYPDEKIVLVIFGPEKTRNFEQNRRRSNARKYLYKNKIIFAEPLLEQFGL